MLDFAASVGISTAKFTSIIAMNTMDIKFDYKIYKEFGLNLVAALPFVKAACADVLEGRMYIRDNPLVNRYFNKEIRRLADLLASQ